MDEKMYELKNMKGDALKAVQSDEGIRSARRGLGKYDVTHQIMTASPTDFTKEILYIDF